MLLAWIMQKRSRDYLSAISFHILSMKEYDKRYLGMISSSGLISDMFCC